MDEALHIERARWSLDQFNAQPERWRWQWLFPQRRRWRNSQTRQEGRHHVDETIAQRAVKEAARRASLTKPTSCHTFRQVSS